MLEELRKNPKDVRFERLCTIAEAFGFQLRGGVREILNFQSMQGETKPYQVRQFIKIIERYGLLEKESDV